jgi:predicted RNA-binding Zn-ribbon protein involved in translation (DUF1610 family)
VTNGAASPRQKRNSTTYRGVIGSRPSPTIALRSVVRRAGPDAVDRHRLDSPDGLRVVHRLAGHTQRLPLTAVGCLEGVALGLDSPVRGGPVGGKATGRLEQGGAMKFRHACPKCGSADIVRVPGGVRAYGAGNNIVVGLTTFSAVPVTRYVCARCGFLEDWIDGPGDLARVLDKFRG